MCWSISAAAQTSLNDQDPLSHRHGSRVMANNSSQLVASYDMQGIHRAYSNPGPAGGKIKYYGSATLMCYIEPYMVLHLFNCKRNKKLTSDHKRIIKILSQINYHR